MSCSAGGSTRLGTGLMTIIRLTTLAKEVLLSLIHIFKQMLRFFKLKVAQEVCKALTGMLPDEFGEIAGRIAELRCKAAECHIRAVLVEVDDHVDD